MDRSRDFDPARRARLWLGVAVLALATAAAIAWLCERTLALPTLVGGFDRSVAAAGDLPVVVLPPVTVVARRSDFETRAATRAAPPRG